MAKNAKHHKIVCSKALKISQTKCLPMFCEMSMAIEQALIRESARSKGNPNSQLLRKIKVIILTMIQSESTL